MNLQVNYAPAFPGWKVSLSLPELGCSVLTVCVLVIQKGYIGIGIYTDIQGVPHLDYVGLKSS